MRFLLQYFTRPIIHLKCRSRCRTFFNDSLWLRWNEKISFLIISSRRWYLWWNNHLLRFICKTGFWHLQFQFRGKILIDLWFKRAFLHLLLVNFNFQIFHFLSNFFFFLLLRLFDLIIEFLDVEYFFYSLSDIFDDWIILWGFYWTFFSKGAMVCLFLLLT